jgi:hypothetical protein
MKPHTVLILVCTFFLAADAPQKPSFLTHQTVAEAYYAQVQRAAEAAKKAEERNSGAMRSETPPTPKKATGLVVDRQGRTIPGARVVIEREASDEVLGEGTTNATGGFEVTLSTQSYKGLTLTVTKDGFTRWAMDGLYGGIVDYRVRLDREVDDQFLKSLIDENDKERKLWMLLEVVGDRQFSTEIQDIFPHIGALRNELLHFVQSRSFAAKDGCCSSPAEQACCLLAYWHDPADEPMFGRWLKSQKHIAIPTETLADRTIAKVCIQWADQHFSGKNPEDRTFNVFSTPLVDSTGDHALVEFWVEYKHWGYSQWLVLTRQQGKWQLRFVAQHRHWQNVPEPNDNGGGRF